MLPQHSAGSAFRYFELAADMVDASTTTSGAQGLRPFGPELIHRINS
ncbi:hypothetical protein RSK20926_01357 [Roseobacter sp. SK209-2-6]|nr:hypothetical protein RSK20926_01357 [Roseobacter sp. SK209-2-6]